MKLIIGLGNPGKKYEKTRHNIGFMVVDEISRKLNLNNFKEKFKGLLIETSYNNEKLFLLINFSNTVTFFSVFSVFPSGPD
ncbi:MAG: hypothetical protein ACPGDB_02585 [Fusobacterium sp.]